MTCHKRVALACVYQAGVGCARRGATVLRLRQEHAKSKTVDLAWGSGSCLWHQGIRISVLSGESVKSVAR